MTVVGGFGATEDQAGNGAEPRSFVIRGSNVKSRSIRWGWEGRMPIGYPTVQTGIEGIGKSVFDAFVIARWTRGELPGEWRDKPVNALVVASEDGIEDTWKPRLDLAGADPDRYGFLNVDELPLDWNIRDGMDALRVAAVELEARVIFIDALLDHMPPAKGGESVNSPTFVRGALGPLKRAVRELDVVGLYSMHPPKGQRASFRDMVQASQAFSAVPRVGLLFAWHPDDQPDEPDSRRVLIRGKGNLGRNPGALEFRVSEVEYEHDDGRITGREVVTDVAPCEVTLADLDPNYRKNERPPTKIEQAADIIREALRDGEWHLAAPIREELERLKLNHNATVDAAKRRLGVDSERQTDVGLNPPWIWQMAKSHDSGANPDSSVAARATLDRLLTVSPQNGSIPNNHGKSQRVSPDERTETENGKESRVIPTTRARTLADLTDRELLAAFPGSQFDLELPDDEAELYRKSEAILAESDVGGDAVNQDGERTPF
jgi:AAA domain